MSSPKGAKNPTVGKVPFIPEFKYKDELIATAVRPDQTLRRLHTPKRVLLLT